MDQEIKNEFKNLRDFLHKNMLTKTQFDQGIEALPKREDFNHLQTSVDGIAKQFKEQDEERIIGAHRAERMETWIIKAATKIGLEYRP